MPCPYGILFVKKTKVLDKNLKYDIFTIYCEKSNKKLF